MKQEIMYRGRRAILVTSNFQAPQIWLGNFHRGVVPTDFDPDFPVNNPVNQEAAEQRGLSYDPSRGGYVDADGFLRRDGFGQPLGG